MIWASSDQSRLVQHNLFGSQSADLRALIAAASGNAAAAAAFAQQAAAAEAADNAAAAAKRARSERARIAHGALMLAAFVLLMPTGVLLSRHKWTFGDQAASKIKPGWFHLHIGVQSLAVLTAIASIILIFAVFGTGRQGVDDVYTPHMGLGIFAVAAAAIQGAIGKFRCAPGRGGPAAAPGVGCGRGALGPCLSPQLSKRPALLARMGTHPEPSDPPPRTQARYH